MRIKTQEVANMVPRQTRLGEECHFELAACPGKFNSDRSIARVYRKVWQNRSSQPGWLTARVTNLPSVTLAAFESYHFRIFSLPRAVAVNSEHQLIGGSERMSEGPLAHRYG